MLNASFFAKIYSIEIEVTIEERGWRNVRSNFPIRSEIRLWIYYREIKTLHSGKKARTDFLECFKVEGGPSGSIPKKKEEKSFSEISIN